MYVHEKDASKTTFFSQHDFQALRPLTHAYVSTTLVQDAFPAGVVVVAVTPHVTVAGLARATGASTPVQL